MLLKAATQLNIRADGLDEHGLAVAVLSACGTNPDSPRNSEDPTPISKMSTAYVVARAKLDAQSHERRHADAAIAASFATVKPSTVQPSTVQRSTVQRTDCGRCGGKSHADIDLEREARARMQRSSRLAWAQGTEHADSAAAIDRIREQTARPFVPSSPGRGDSVPTDELAARQAMLASSRTAYLEPSPDPLATDKE